MSATKIRAALETALNAMSPILDTAWENVDFTPAPGTAYQMANILFTAPYNPTVGDGFHRELGFLQVSLMYPQHVGTKDINARAELLRTTFARGNSFTNGGVTVIIDGTPDIRPGVADDDRWRVNVLIPFYANIC